MRPRDQGLAKQLASKLRSFSSKHRALPGIDSPEYLAAFVEQLVESIRRVNYIFKIRNQEHSPLRADPSSILFDPIKAAVLRKNQGLIDEASWLVFLSVHFGKHRRTGWQLARDIYGRMGKGPPWDWTKISANPQRFRQWLASNEAVLSGDGIARCFGNHRKYLSLDAWSPTQTGAAFETYVKWVGPPRTHHMLFQEALEQNAHDPKKTFDYLYKSMSVVASFGRTGRFDYLTMVGKLGLAAIAPGRTYLQGATGPNRGAQLLFGGSVKAGLRRPLLESYLVDLGTHLGVGMQELEDSLCNWQKSPAKFLPFRG